MSKKVLCALSGGIDSSVAALLLKRKGFQVAGVTMNLGIKSSQSEKTVYSGSGTVSDAKKVCEKLDVPHYVLDFSKEMQDLVVTNMTEEYSSGRTPNPCVLCNRRLKFDKLLTYALDRGFDYLATGHYAGIIKKKNNFCLRRAKDKQKDQSYFLYSINPEYLPFILFPLSDISKHQVCNTARQEHLPVNDKPQSQDLCFLIDKKNKPDFFKKRGLAKKGAVVDLNGRFLAEHPGIVNYTVGQRIGLGIAAGKPLYVKKINAQKNQIVVAEKKEIRANGLTASLDSWFVDEYPARMDVQIRYRHKAVISKVEFINGSNQKIRAAFGRPQEAVTPGQSAVFYMDDTLYGGGIIEESF